MMPPKTVYEQRDLKTFYVVEYGEMSGEIHAEPTLFRTREEAVERVKEQLLPVSGEVGAAAQWGVRLRTVQMVEEDNVE